MPSPFPGMDPYLEGTIWMSFHQQISGEIARRLAPILRPRYVVLCTERFVFEEGDDVAVTTGNIYPDASLSDAVTEHEAGPVAVTIEPPLRLATVMPSPIPHTTVEIRDTEERRLVTAIEVLSPTNKRGEGRHEYLAKRRRILLSDAHLVELDFLRGGTRVPMQQPLPDAPFFAFVSRAERRPWTDVWPMQLSDTLPDIPAPLLAGDEDVPLELQSIFETLYDLFSYDLSLDYTGPPSKPLNDDDSKWADQLLRDAGLRQ